VECNRKGKHTWSNKKCDKNYPRSTKSRRRTHPKRNFIFQSHHSYQRHVWHLYGIPGIVLPPKTTQADIHPPIPLRATVLVVHWPRKDPARSSPIERSATAARQQSRNERGSRGRSCAEMDSARQSPTRVFELVQHISQMGTSNDVGRSGAPYTGTRYQGSYQPLVSQSNTRGVEICEFILAISSYLLRQSNKVQPKHLVYNLFSTYFSPEPLAVLIAFVVVPAHKRLVFIMGADLIWGLFYHTVVRAFAVWALKTEFLQQLMRNITASTEKMQAGGPEMPGRFRYDEL
jgi:hypothetical protein